MDSPEDLSLSIAQILCHAVGLGFTATYALTKHYLCNNGLGLAYSLEVCLINWHNPPACMHPSLLSRVKLVHGAWVLAKAHENLCMSATSIRLQQYIT